MDLTADFYPALKDELNEGMKKEKPTKTKYKNAFNVCILSCLHYTGYRPGRKMLSSLGIFVVVGPFTCFNLIPL